MKTEKDFWVKDQEAGFGRRFLAFLIDGLVVLIGMRLGRLFSEGSFFGFWILFWVLGYLTLATYFLGTTVGKNILGLKVVSVDQEKLKFFQVLLREWWGKFLSLIPLGLGFIWMVWDKRKQTWHDKLAGTLVVKENK